MLDEDAKMRTRMRMENRAELKKTAAIAEFKLTTQMEQNKMDLQARADK